MDWFWEAQTTKNQEKIVLKNVYFFNFDFLAPFCDFLRFWPDFGRPWAFQKLKKIRKNRLFNAFSSEGEFWEGSGGVLEEF